MEEISSKCCKFFKCGKLVFKFLKVLSFKVKVFGREFFELLRISTLKFKKVCGREFLKLLRISTLKFKKVCEREVFELLKHY